MLYLVYLIALLFRPNTEINQYIFLNDVHTDGNDLAVTFIPKGCTPDIVFVDYLSYITFNCTLPIKQNDTFSFEGSVGTFPYFVTPTCFFGDYKPPYVNISNCVS